MFRILMVHAATHVDGAVQMHAGESKFEIIMSAKWVRFWFVDFFLGFYIFLFCSKKPCKNWYKIQNITTHFLLFHSNTFDNTFAPASWHHSRIGGSTRA